MTAPWLKRGLKWGGRILAFAGLVFVAERLYQDGAQLDLARLGPWHWLALAVLALIYGIAGGALGLAWRELLHWLGASTARRWAIHVYGLSQIAKYLPGNVFHLASRQGMGVAAGIPGWPLAKSAVWDLGTLAVAGALFALLALPLALQQVPPAWGSLLFVLGVGGATILSGLLLDASVSRALLWDVLFLSVSGLLFLALLLIIGAIDELAPLLLVSAAGAYVLAWLAGFLTPGVPAGVGVREAVLILLLGSGINEPDLILAVLLGRLVTVAGDIVFFGLAMLLNGEHRQSEVT